MLTFILMTSLNPATSSDPESVKFTSRITEINPNFQTQSSQADENVTYFHFLIYYQIQTNGQSTEVIVYRLSSCSPTQRGIPITVLNTTGEPSDLPLYYSTCTETLNPEETTTVIHSDGISNGSTVGYLAFNTRNSSKLPSGFYYLKMTTDNSSSGAFIVSRDNQSRIEIIYEDKPLNWSSFDGIHQSTALVLYFDSVSLLILMGLVWLRIKKLSFR
ncbi:MAG: hypothetical protein IH840_01900 [Candidatus Heimdallarchaeota archaeon]|nr:hypothetical protein [Candidatus Heimdallarchaeota archaeon]